MTSREKPWHKNAPNLLVVNSILAAISAIVIQATKGNIVWLLCGIIALLLFIVSAEKITETFDTDDVRTYVAYFLPYNFGVLFLFVALLGIIRHYSSLSSELAGPITVASGAVLFVVWLLVWGKDSWFLIGKDNQTFEGYLKELEGEHSSKDSSDCLTRLFYWIRSWLPLLCQKSEKELPHDNVYVRLRPSPIHGVGVFAVLPIKKGTNLFSGDGKIVWVDEKDIASLPESIKQLYEDFAIIRNGRYGCPISFNQLTPSWYLNDSDNPNVRVDENYNMSALRDIKADEELTIDSSNFSEQPYRRE